MTDSPTSTVGYGSSDKQCTSTLSRKYHNSGILAKYLHSDTGYNWVQVVGIPEYVGVQ
jgi:hypothetical protein